MKKIGLIIALLLAASAATTQAAPTPPPQAKGVLKTAAGESIGNVLFTQGMDGTVFVSVSAKGLPQGEHGLSVREKGACTPDFNAAGAAVPTDLPALNVTGSNVSLNATTKTVAVSGGSGANLLDADGSAVVITANKDENAKAACAVLEAVPVPAPAAEAANATQASVTIKNAVGDDVGTGTFTQNSDGTVRVQVSVRGLPAGDHGIHVHQFGQCAPTFGAAGEHHNPTNSHHGPNNPAPPKPHSGDLPNLTVAADGSGTLDTTSTVFTLSASDTTILDSDGSALVIHANPDDLASDPSGNSGARIACGVIQASAAAAPTAVPATAVPATAVPGTAAPATAAPATAAPAVTPTQPAGGVPGQLPNTGAPRPDWLLWSLLAFAALTAGLFTRRAVRR
ncbi:MAG TPA: superoxide dismutase family protein [Herpetosiphonaceae bacterium]|nr:superoxide dismutase family protein [Herpetosiphonaceae bacterium]